MEKDNWKAVKILSEMLRNTNLNESGKRRVGALDLLPFDSFSCSVIANK